jgi:hypothetical protein
MPGIGNLVSFAATVYGLGALAVAAWRAAHARSSTEAPAPVAAST